MAHPDAIVVLKADRAQRSTDHGFDIGIVSDVALGLVENQVTGSTGSDDIHALAFRQSQVPRCQRIGRQFVDGKVGGCATTIPVVEFLSLDRQGPEHREQ